MPFFRKIIRIAAAAALLLLTAAAVPVSADDTTPYIPIGNEVVTGVVLTSGPTKSTYFVGDSLDLTGASLRIDYNTGRSEAVSVLPGWCSEFESYAEGDVQIIVQYPYGGDPVSFTVSVVTPAVSKIEITSYPDKRVFYTGDRMDTSGITVIATYTNGRKWDITNEITFSGFDTSTAANDRVVTCVYQSGGNVYTASYTIDVYSLEPERLEIRRMPTRIEYYDGERFDPSGIIVAVVYNDRSEILVSDLGEMTIEGYNPGQLGEQTIKVTCRGKAAMFTVRTVRSEAHVHSPGDYIVDREPTCTEPGKKHCNCTVCGEIIPETNVEIEPTGHKWGEWTVISRPTGLTEGVREHVCTVCSAVERDQTPRLSDTVSDGTVTARRGIGNYFPEDALIDATSVIYVIGAEELSKYETLPDGTAGIVDDVYSVSFYSEGKKIPIEGETLYTVKVTGGDYLGYRIAVGDEIIKASWDKSAGTVSFSCGAAADENGFRMVVIAVSAPAEKTTPAVTTAPDEPEKSSAGPDTEETVTDTAVPVETTAPTTSGSRGNAERVGQAIRVIIAVIAGIVLLTFVIALVWRKVVD